MSLLALLGMSSVDELVESRAVLQHLQAGAGRCGNGQRFCSYSLQNPSGARRGEDPRD